MNDTDPFVLACLHAPTDAGPRLVFSDWLEERGWDALRLAALRGEGDWRVDPDGTACWGFRIDNALRRLYSNSDFRFVDPKTMYGHHPLWADLPFGPVPAGGPVCHACETEAVDLRLTAAYGMINSRGVSGPERVWRCGAAKCAVPFSKTLGYLSDRYVWAEPPTGDLDILMNPAAVAALMREAMAAGLVVPDSWLRSAVGLTPPEEGPPAHDGR